MRVLVIDDSAVMRKIIVKALFEAGHPEVFQVDNATVAMQMVKDADIICTDWNMPVMDGLTFVKEVRKKSSVPIVMVTTVGGQKEVLEAMRFGVNDYIVKPFKPLVLIGKLEGLAQK